MPSAVFNVWRVDIEDIECHQDEGQEEKPRKNLPHAHDETAIAKMTRDAFAEAPAIDQKQERAREEHQGSYRQSRRHQVFLPPRP